VLVSHPAVAEAAAIGVPDALKGESLWCVCVPAAGRSSGRGRVDELRALVARELGSPFRPARVVFVDVLPRTRSGKVVRRIVRSIACGEQPGELSGLDNPEALAALRSVFAESEAHFAASVLVATPNPAVWPRSQCSPGWLARRRIARCS
jgi:acetyl-CoA synthetase